MTRVAFIGLGIMGAPMAANLVDAGFEVVGHNRSRRPVEELVERGGEAASSVAEAVQGADVVITMLPDSPDVDEVALGEDGILASGGKGLLYADMSTIAPATARRVAEAAAQAEMRVLDAPVSGGQSGAVDGSLSVMVGGEAEDFDAARPLFNVVGATVIHVGGHGAGQTVKAANQLIVAGTIELVAEAIVFLEANAVDAQAAMQVLAGGLAGNRILDSKAEGMLARRFQPGFRVDLHHKDLGILMASARDAGVVLPVGAVVAELMAALRAQGDGGLDHTALVRLADRLCGRG
jgi:2-hydroxy-3-oxopropionate reductase